MKFVAIFLILFVLLYAFSTRDFRAAVNHFFRRFWLPLIGGLFVAVAFFVLAYSGESMRLF